MCYLIAELWHNCRLGASDNTHQWYNRQLQYQQEEREQQAIKSRKRKSVKDDEQPVEQLKRLREDKSKFLKFLDFWYWYICGRFFSQVYHDDFKNNISDYVLLFYFMSFSI